MTATGTDPWWIKVVGQVRFATLWSENHVKAALSIPNELLGYLEQLQLCS
jgi:hypothetical protein